MLHSHPLKTAIVGAMFAGLLLSTSASIQAEPPSFLRLFGKKKVESDPGKDYGLTEIEGPWLIMADTFTGPSGKDKAKQLALELRSEYNLPAFVYHEDFDFSSPIENKNDIAGRRLRYNSAYRFEAYAVLVGEFDSVDHPDVPKTLETLKSITPRTYSQVSAEDEVGAMATIRRIKNQIVDAAKGAPVKRGPMYRAFVTKNPLLPDNFTQAPEVDSFIRKLNENVEHSLLDCNGKFTVLVKTLEGASTTMLGSRIKEDIAEDQSKERLDQNMLMAHKLTETLRKQGVEAYEFHDRTRSLVTVGSFDQLGTNTPNGFRYHPSIQSIIDRFALNQRFEFDPSGNPQLTGKTVAGVALNAKPHPIAVPKTTKRSFYSAAFGK